VSVGVTLAQRLADLNGRPTSTARLAAVALAASAAAAGFAAGPREHAPAPARASVPANRLAGELPVTVSAQGPGLPRAAAIPDLAGGRTPARRPARQAPAPPTLVSTPVPSATPTPTPTPAATAVPPPLTTAPPAAPAPARPAPPRPAPAPPPPPLTETFDSSG